MDQTAPTRKAKPAKPDTLLKGRMIFCPWCWTWNPLESYTALQTPPDFADNCPPIFKHGGDSGCKKLFSLYVKA